MTRAPDMPLLLEENYTRVLTEKLKKAELDAMIVATPVEDPSIVVLRLYEEPFVVAVPDGHAWKKMKAIESRELENESLLLLGSGHCFRDQVLKVCPALNRSASDGLQKTLESSSLETIRHMVTSGMGTTVLPCTATRLHSSSDSLLAYRPFSKPAPTRVVSLAWRKSFPRPRAIEAVRQAVLATSQPCVEKIRPSLARRGRGFFSFS